MAEMKLEVVPVPVTDIDRAKAFYADKVGFNVDHDVRPAETIGDSRAPTSTTPSPLELASTARRRLRLMRIPVKLN